MCTTCETLGKAWRATLRTDDKAAHDEANKAMWEHWVESHATEDEGW